MNLNANRSTRVSIFVLAIILTSLTAFGQERYAQSGASMMSVQGTSTLHDWNMTSKEVVYDALFETSNATPVKLTSLTVSVPAESLKSGKSAMDKNAYNALKTNAHKQIVFQLTSSKMDGKSILCTGKLTVAGTTKQIDLEVTYTTLPNGALQCKGSEKLVMTEYGVEPPSFMFGSVTTGDEITVSFDVTLAPKKLQPVTLN